MDMKFKAQRVLKTVYENKKAQKVFTTVIDKFTDMMLKVKEDSDFYGGADGDILDSMSKIVKIIKKRSLEYIKEDRKAYRYDTAQKTAKVVEVIEVYTELLARGYSPEEAVVEIGEKIDFNVENTEDQDYDYNKYVKEE